MGRKKKADSIPARDQTPPGKHVWLGTMEKRGHCRRTWKKRYFIIDGKTQKMCYFKDPDQVNAIGEVVIHAIEACDLYHAYGLEMISKGGKVFYVKPSSEEEQDQLIALLLSNRRREARKQAAKQEGDTRQMMRLRGKMDALQEERRELMQIQESSGTDLARTVALLDKQLLAMIGDLAILKQGGTPKKPAAASAAGGGSEDDSDSGDSDVDLGNSQTYGAQNGHGAASAAYTQAAAMAAAKFEEVDAVAEAAASLIQAMFRGQQYRQHVASELRLGKTTISGDALRGGPGARARGALGVWGTGTRGGAVAKARASAGEDPPLAPAAAQRGDRTASMVKMAQRSAGMGRALTSEQQLHALQMCCRMWLAKTMRRRQENLLIKPLGLRVLSGVFPEATNPRVLVSVVSGAGGAGHEEERDVFLAPTTVALGGGGRHAVRWDQRLELPGVQGAETRLVFTVVSSDPHDAMADGALVGQAVLNLGRSPNLWYRGGQHELQLGPLQHRPRETDAARGGAFVPLHDMEGQGGAEGSATRQRGSLTVVLEPRAPATSQCGFLFIKTRELKFLGKTVGWRRMWVALSPYGIRVYSAWPAVMRATHQIPCADVQSLKCRASRQEAQAAAAAHRYGLDMSRPEFEITTPKMHFSVKFDTRTAEGSMKELVQWTRKIQRMAAMSGAVLSSED